VVAKTTMQFNVDSFAKRFAAVATVLLAAVLYVTFAAKQFLAEHYSKSPAYPDIHRAAALDPGNAQYADDLGRYLISQQSPDAALPWFHTATRLNSHAAKYWVDLAAAQQSLADATGEGHSLQQALLADPHTPRIAWDAANLYLAQNLRDEALKLFRSVLENDPVYSAAALNTCWRVRPDADALLATVVPPQADAAFLEFLVARKETAAANKVWERMVSLQQPLERRYLFEYLRHLILSREVSQASLVWQQAGKLSGLEAYQSSTQNLLVNGDFSLDILDGGFDWVHRELRGASLALDPTEMHSSSRSLRVTLDGPGITDAGIVQMIPVDPDTTYEFSGFYKARDMDGAGGMEFAFSDAYKNTTLFMSEDLRDADFWKETGGTFSTGPETTLIALRIARVPSGSPIRGKLWIDGLRLVRREKEINLAQKQAR
jgi:tetratricopeptide (TPR) repeat protein